MVRLAQTVHLSCDKISSISKWNETSFHLSLVTKEYHRVHAKWFLSLWYIQRKPCTYLVSRLEPSPNGTKRASTWASSPSTIGCVQNNFWAYDTLAQTVHLSCTDTKPVSKRIKTRFTWHPRKSIGCVQNEFRPSGTFCANRAHILRQD
jgi:hypothetical protein